MMAGWSCCRKKGVVGMAVWLAALFRNEGRESIGTHCKQEWASWPSDLSLVHFGSSC